MMKLIVGLGNPGVQYERTRHNAGFLAVDALADKHAPGAIARGRFHAVTLDCLIGNEKVLLMKPTTYVNRSGQAVGEAARFFKLEPARDLLVLVDDKALPVGAIRVRASGGTGGHNGLADIDRVLGGPGYPRLRIGIGDKPPMMNQADWVLSRFMKEEREDLERGIRAAVEATECVVSDGVAVAMNRFNRRLSPPGPDAAPDTETETNQEQRHA